MRNLKPLTSKRTGEKKRNTFGMIITLFIAIMFLGSTIGYIFYSENQDNNNEIHTYKNYKFVQTDYGWQTNTDYGQIATTYLPEETKDIECDCVFLNYQTLQANKAYVVALTSSERYAANELLRNFQFNNVQLACLPEDANNSECENIPLKSCKNADSSTRIIIFKEKEIISEGENMSKLVSGKIGFDNNCLIIEGKDLIKVSDKVIFKIFEIE
ncbi:MAG: hypothetical protein KJ767_02225 [Nanoarchaeota archaeon]|nr:hypothetical protein [Nanoarchaeota archaeon]